MGDLVIAVDWSARSAPSPTKPSPDACWLAWAWTDDRPGKRPSPEYFRTRRACEARLVDLLDACAGSALVGFDFPLGYPLADDSSEVLPVGRTLFALLDRLIKDDDANANNRFAIAERLNADIAARFASPHGPFWGCPATHDCSDGRLSPTRRPVEGVPEFRAVERHIRETRRLAIQSAWKLYTTGSVGSQALLGLPVVHRLLEHYAARARAWPFEPIDRPRAIVFTEIWPSLFDCSGVDHPIKDARQVVATRDAIIDNPGVRATLRVSDPRAPQEGWILGIPDPEDAHSSRRSPSHTV